jgi:GNAT superfamily N-acetyltransferase
MKIRQATPADVATIADFNARIARETENRELEPARVKAGVSALLQDAAKGIYFVAEIDGQIVGQVLITYEWSDWRNGNFWWIQSVYVDKEFRGQGIFRALFEHVQDLAKQRQDVCGLRLYMDCGNDTARRSYERLGMKRTDYEVFEVDFVLSHE